MELMETGEQRARLRSYLAAGKGWSSAAKVVGLASDDGTARVLTQIRKGNPRRRIAGPGLRTCGRTFLLEAMDGGAQPIPEGLFCLQLGAGFI
jgi:hypothetical protein